MTPWRVTVIKANGRWLVRLSHNNRLIAESTFRWRWQAIRASERWAQGRCVVTWHRGLL